MLALHMSLKFISTCVRGRADRTLYCERNVLLLNVPGHVPAGSTRKSALQTMPSFSTILLPPFFKSWLNQGIYLIVVV